jgi:putative nucleotidyltransferase with HDIG domain
MAARAATEIGVDRLLGECARRRSRVTTVSQAAMMVVYVTLGIAAGVLSGREARLRADKLRDERRLHREVVLKSLAGLSAALKWRDATTRRHSAAVGELSASVAQTLGLAPDRIETVRLAGAVHDIGKIGLADDVLLKPGSLTPDERRAVEAHADVAADILGPIPGAEEIAAIVRSHHEALDGSGYPRGLSGDAIPLETRIVTAADVYCALTEQRPYKDGMSARDAVALMSTTLRAKLDTQVLAALTGVVAGAWIAGGQRNPRTGPGPRPADSAEIPGDPAAS